MESLIIERALQILVRIFLEIWDFTPWPFRGRFNFKPMFFSVRRLYTTAFALVCGIILSQVSLTFAPNALIASPPGRMAALALLPIACAYAAKGAANYRTYSDRAVVPRDWFWMGFWFGAGLVAVRFAYAHHV